MSEPSLPSVDLTAALAQERQLVPAEVMRLPSMLSYDERALLHWAAREGLGAAGAIIDAGCFLGGSTLALGLGLIQGESERGGTAAAATGIHSFDLFRVGEERERVYFDDDFPFEVGAPTVDLFERNIAPVRSRVAVHEGDINQLRGWCEDISVLFIDIAKSWDTNDTLVSQFFPHLVSDAVLVQQDLIHFGHPWCALTMELLSDHFEFLGYVPFSSAVYRVISPVPLEKAPTRLLERLTADESLALIERCAQRVGAPHEGYVRLASATCAWFYDQPDRARQIISELTGAYDDDTLPWFSEGLAYISQLTDGMQASAPSRADRGYPGRPRTTLAPTVLADRHALLSVINLFQAGSWQMTAGERAALEGVLSQLKPAVAIEIGTAEGGSLACIAGHAAAVHSFDLVEPQLALEDLPHVSIHTGDSHQTLPRTLTLLSDGGANVDFVLVDGDHTTEGVKRDIEDLLTSRAVSRTIILIHDTANEIVRAGLEAVDYGSWPKVRFVDLDFVPGYLVKAEAFHHDIWGGLGLVIVDESGDADVRPPLLSDLAYPITGILAEHRARLDRSATNGSGSSELDELRAQAAELERRLAVIAASRSWQVTAPLRRLAARLRR